MIKNIPLYFLLIIISGCAERTNVPWMAVDGNKAGATIKLSCVYNTMFEKQGSYYNANAIATSKCREWGYAKAKPF